MSIDNNTSVLYSALEASKTLIAALTVAVIGLCLLFLPAAFGVPAPWPEMSRTLGGVLLPSGVIGLIYELALKKALMNEIRFDLREIIQSENSTFMKLAASGIDAVYPTFPSDEVGKQLAESTTYVRVLQTWIPDICHIEQGMLLAVGRGAKAQILILDPKSPQCLYRGRDIGYSDEVYISNAIQANLGEIERFAIKNKITESVEVRLYDSTPTISMYSCEKYSYIGWFWLSQQCVQGAFLKISRKGDVLASAFDTHFNNLWQKSVPYDFKRGADSN